MKKITLDSLRQYGLRMGGQCEITEAACRERAGEVDWDVAARRLLPAHAHAAYEAATELAWLAAKRTTAPAWAEHERAMAPAWAACQARAISLDQYERAEAVSRARYERATAPARARYSAHAAAAFWAAYSDGDGGGND